MSPSYLSTSTLKAQSVSSRAVTKARYADVWGLQRRPPGRRPPPKQKSASCHPGVHASHIVRKDPTDSTWWMNVTYFDNRRGRTAGTCRLHSAIDRQSTDQPTDRPTDRDQRLPLFGLSTTANRAKACLVKRIPTASRSIEPSSNLTRPLPHSHPLHALLLLLHALLLTLTINPPPLPAQ